MSGADYYYLEQMVGDARKDLEQRLRDLARRVEFLEDRVAQLETEPPPFRPPDESRGLTYEDLPDWNPREESR